MNTTWPPDLKAVTGAQEGPGRPGVNAHRVRMDESDDDQNQKPCQRNHHDIFGADGAASDMLGGLPPTLHDPRLLRPVSPNWSITTLRSTDNIPSTIPKALVTMDAEDSPWGGACNPDLVTAGYDANQTLSRRTFSVKLPCESR